MRRCARKRASKHVLTLRDEAAAKSKWPGRSPRPSRFRSGMREKSGGLDLVLRVPQHIAATPDRLDIVLAPGRGGELFPQLADEHVDDLELGLVHAAIEMVQEHLLGERRALAERTQLQHQVLLVVQMLIVLLHFGTIR